MANYLDSSCLNCQCKTKVIPQEAHFPYAKFCGHKCRKEYEENPDNKDEITWCSLKELELS